MLLSRNTNVMSNVSKLFRIEEQKNQGVWEEKKETYGMTLRKLIFFGDMKCFLKMNKYQMKQ